MSTLHICRPTSYAFRRIVECPTCAQRRLMLVEMTMWYGTTSTCLTCGDAWDHEYGRLERPFRPRWRADRVARAKTRPYALKADATAALMAEADEYITDGAA